MKRLKDGKVWCEVCKQYLDPSLFHRDTTRSPGYQCCCKKCRLKRDRNYQRRYYLEHRATLLPKHRLSATIPRWNYYYPPGTKVQLTNDDGEIEETKTRSIAWLLGITSTGTGAGTPVVLVEGRTGGYLLERIRPVRAFSPDDICKGVYPCKVKVIRTCGNCGEKFPGIVEYAKPHLSTDPDDYIRQLDAHRETHNKFEGWGVNWASV